MRSDSRGENKSIAGESQRVLEPLTRKHNNKACERGWSGLFHTHTVTQEVMVFHARMADGSRTPGMGAVTGAGPPHHPQGPQSLACSQTRPQQRDCACEITGVQKLLSRLAVHTSLCIQQ